MNEIIPVRDYVVPRLILWCLVMLLFVKETSNFNNTCPKEISSIPNSTDFAVWQSYGNENNIIISYPPCLDNQEKLAVRICHNQTWVPKSIPECKRVWSETSGCLNSYEYTQNCIFLAEPSPWETNCNLARRDTVSDVRNQLMWLPVKRRTEYGQYEVASRGKNYAMFFQAENILYNIQDVFKKDCLVINTENGEITAANCKEIHPRICAPNREDICPNNCVYSQIENKCYCKIRFSECKDPIEIRTPDDFLMLQTLIDDDECYVGNTAFPDVNLKSSKQYMSDGVWSYTDRNLSCSVCSYSIHQTDREKVEMLLTFYEETKELTLIIYTPLQLAYAGDEDYVYCFEGFPNKLRKRVQIEKIFNPPEIPPNGDIPYYVYKVYLEKYIHNYWCEAHLSHLSDELVLSNQILAYQERNGYEYSLRLKVQNACDIFNCTQAINSNFDNFIPNELIEALGDLKYAVRIFDIKFFDFVKLDYILHITTETHEDFITEFNDLLEKIEKIKGHIEVVGLRSSEFCLPQRLLIEQDPLSFPLTSIGQVVVPIELCLQKNNVPVFRMCEGGFLYGSSWSNVNGECDVTEASETTKYIHSISNQNLSRDCVANVSKLVRKEDLSIVDVYFVSKILRKANDLEESGVVSDSLDIVDGLMKVEEKTLKQAQNLLNATDDILDSFEKLTIKPIQGNSLLIQKENYIIHVTKPFKTNVSGVLLYSQNNTVTIKDFKINSSYENVEDKENLKFAVQIPYYQLEEWWMHNATNDLRIITTIFFDRKLFNSDSANQEGPVVDVVVPGFGHFLKYPIQIWFRSSEGSKSGTCAFWDFGRKYQRYKGKWSGIGGMYLGRITDSTIDVCLFTHLTHFTLLVIDSYIEESDEYILTVLTYIGDFLTFFGLTGIFATAIVFESWRRRQGTKILLNLSAAIIMEDLVTSLLQTKTIGSERSCKYIGPTLQYIIISKYCWMLVYAFLQYVRFVKVLGPVPTNIVLKSVLFGWGVPFIPVMVVCFFNPYNYGIKNYLFCYPKDAFLYIGLLIPVSIIIITNTVVFFIVMRNVTAKTAEVYSRNLEATSHKLQFHLATLLFFVLGLPMMLGLLSNLVPIVWLQTTMVYLYCITSNLQGFMLFLFYVILNKETRNKWIHYYTGRRKLSLSVSSKTKS